MKHRPFFSIITVVRNNETSILRCIDSINSQIFRDFEHIIIDGDSTDSTVNKIDNYIGNNETNISKFISEPDSGIYSAMNKGLGYAKGIWLYFLNSDDYFFCETVLLNAHKSLRGKSIDLLYGRIIIVDENSGDISFHAPSLINNFRLLSGGLYQQAWFLKRETAVAIGQFDTKLRLCADIDYLMRAKRMGVKIECSPIGIAVFCKGGASYDFESVRREHFLVERRNVNFVTWVLIKSYRSFLRSLVRILKGLGKGIFD
jgi:glycosyltransferase involved in cell wall biosynthesis